MELPFWAYFTLLHEHILETCMCMHGPRCSGRRDMWHGTHAHSALGIAWQRKVEIFFSFNLADSSLIRQTTEGHTYKSRSPLNVKDSGAVFFIQDERPCSCLNWWVRSILKGEIRSKAEENSGNPYFSNNSISLEMSCESCGYSKLWAMVEEMSCKGKSERDLMGVNFQFWASALM